MTAGRVERRINDESYVFETILNQGALANLQVIFAATTCVKINSEEIKRGSEYEEMINLMDILEEATHLDED